jgi:glycosyltransferase involved in cell wall biosynthesis
MPNDMQTEEPDQVASDFRRLEAENAALRAALARAETSASVQAMRAGARGWDAVMALRQVEVMRRSLFWRITLPLRLAVDLARGAPKTGLREAWLLRRFLVTVRRKGPAHAWRQAWGLLQRGRRRVAASKKASSKKAGPAPGGAAPALAASAPLIRPAAEILAPCVLIVADLILPQCTKYRVWQKQELFTRLGVRCRVVDWRYIYTCRAAASLATQAILYRVPATPEVLGLIDWLDQLGVPAWWEVDDLIFDVDLYKQNSNLADLEPEERDELLQDAALHRKAMLRINRGIASTPGLANAMRQAGVAEVAVVENALDAETLEAAAVLRAERAAMPPRESVLIVYGSGTRTHDTDFRLVAPALERLLQARPAVRLRIVGDLNLPPSLLAFGDRVEHLQSVPFTVYLRRLADADISIAPLEPSQFNDAKSSIKYLEAAILGRPAVCSPRAAFADVIENGGNGYLAESEAEWFAALDALAGNAALRARIGQAALATALSRFSPDRIAANAVAPLVIPDQRGARPKLRVAFVNVYFAPRSYGGATFVVEQMAAKFAADPNNEVHIYTSLDPDIDLGLTRSAQGRLHIYAAPTASGDTVGDFDNPEAADLFGQFLDAVQPDIVHLHAVQQLSASIAEACWRRGIPYVITLHDAWWICARQFMVRGDGTYCFQKRIDLRVCEACNPVAKHLAQRQLLLRGVLDGAALLLSPSTAHREVYLAQGIPPEHIEVAPNGVVLPATRPARPSEGPLRFAYVGGYDAVKGYFVLRDAFGELKRSDWELRLVDNTLNLGFSSMDTSTWKVRGKLRVVPAYKQNDMDEFFAGIDVLLFPSQWKESFGLTVREAMARDVWVIATEGGGPADAITDGVNGTIIPLDGRPGPLRAAIEALLDNPGKVRGFRNPLSSQIIDYDEQARALHATLTYIVAASREKP